VVRWMEPRSADGEAKGPGSRHGFLISDDFIPFVGFEAVPEWRRRMGARRPEAASKCFTVAGFASRAIPGNGQTEFVPSLPRPTSFWQSRSRFHERSSPAGNQVTQSNRPLERICARKPPLLANPFSVGKLTSPGVGARTPGAAQSHGADLNSRPARSFRRIPP
jgi:hypothetical protein